MVAVGSLDKVWITVPEDVTEEQLQDAFRSHFNAQWAEVLDTSNKSYTYNAFNNAYFSVHNLSPIENLTVEQILKEKGIVRAPNIIVS
jgi:hypothetical protein